MLGFLRESVRELGQTIVMVTHDPVAAAYADRVFLLADGRLVGELAEPTADRVLDLLQRAGGLTVMRTTLAGLRPTSCAWCHARWRSCWGWASSPAS